MSATSWQAAQRKKACVRGSRWDTRECLLGWCPESTKCTKYSMFCLYLTNLCQVSVQSSTVRGEHSLYFLLSQHFLFTFLMFAWACFSQIKKKNIGKEFIIYAEKKQRLLSFEQSRLNHIILMCSISDETVKTPLIILMSIQLMKNKYDT